jgi:hypothetical protein
MFGTPRRIGGQGLVRADQEVGPDPAEQRVQLAGFGIGQPKPGLTLDRSEDILDARDEWPRLGRGREQIRATVMRIRQARHEARRLQSVEQADNGYRREVETVSKRDLIEASRLLELEKHGAPCACHSGKPGVHRSLAPPAP